MARKRIGASLSKSLDCAADMNKKAHHDLTRWFAPLEINPTSGKTD